MKLINVPVSSSAPTGEHDSGLQDDVQFALELILSMFSDADHMADEWKEEEKEALDLYAHSLEEIIIATLEHRATGLQKLCRRMSEQLMDLRRQEHHLSTEERNLLSQWPPLLLAYLDAKQEHPPSEALVHYLQDQHWPVPLPPEEGEVLLALLQTDPFSRQSEDIEAKDESESQGRDTDISDIVVSSDAALSIEALLCDPDDFSSFASMLQESNAHHAPITQGDESEVAEATLCNPGAASAIDAQGDECAATSDSERLNEFTPEASLSVPEPGSSEPDEDFDSDSLLPAEASPDTPPQSPVSASGDHAHFESVFEEPDSETENRQSELKNTSTTPPTLSAPDEVAGSDTLQFEEGFVNAKTEPPLPNSSVQTHSEPETNESDGEDGGFHTNNAPAEQIADILALTEMAGLIGLQEVCLRLQQNIQQSLTRDGEISSEIHAMLTRFTDLAYTYIGSPQQPNISAELVEFLGAQLWPEPLVGKEAEGLQFILEADCGKEPSVAALSESVANRETPQESYPAESFSAVDEPIVAETQIVNEEFIILLTSELASVQEDLEELLAESASPVASTIRKKETVENYAEQMQRLGLAAQTIGLSAMQTFLSSLRGRILGAAEAGFTSPQRETLALLPGAILAYLAAPDDPSTTEGLIDLLRSDAWTQPLEMSYATTLSRALSLVELTTDMTDNEARQTEALPEDISLELPNDLNQELLDGLLQEIPLHTSEFSAAIQRIGAGNGTLADVDVAKRAAHTLKGAANTVGVKGIANLTHHVEDILVALSKYEVLPNHALAEALTNAGDCLEEMGEAVMGTGPAPDYALTVLQEVLDWANRIDHEGVPEDASPVVPKAHTPMESPSAQQEVEAPAASPPVQHTEAMVRVPANLIDELLRLMGETIISTGQVRERLRRLVQQNKTIQQQNRVFLQLATELEELVDLRDGARDIGMARKEDEFDPLEFEHYSELHTVSRRLIEAATDSGELSGEVESELADLNELVEVQNRLHMQSQNTVMRTRMVPVTTVASRLQRSVRQAARLLDKQVILNVVGADTMVDNNILNELVDPLMHILRNAVDHGIEAPEQRAAAGKTEEGHIELAFLREGNQVVVRCRDDGAGLDLDAIRRTAEEKGLLASGQTQSDDELARLILAPGFSTRAESTQISGRGIGMDVVHSRLLQLKGGVSLHTTSGKGMEIELRLPATLLSTYALLVRAREQVFAISSYGVLDIHYVTDEQLQRVGGESFFRSGDELYALSELDSLLNLPGDRRGNDRKSGFPLLLVRQENGVVQAVRVQEIIDSSELVVKNLGRYIPKPQGVVGATILGDGSVAAVIDVPELMRKPVQLPHDRDQADEHRTGNDAVQRAVPRFSALVVDDSLSARRATAQFMKDAGFEVRTAIDGLEAVSMLDKWKPDILLVDMEMPRMNGLELTAHVRARTGMTQLPVIMITSRSTEKHRRQAEAAGVNIYLTKPFGDDELLRHVTQLTAA